MENELTHDNKALDDRHQGYNASHNICAANLRNKTCIAYQSVAECHKTYSTGTRPAHKTTKS